MKKKYLVFDSVTEGEIRVEIDHSFENIDRILKQMVEFWANTSEDLEREGGNYLKCWLKILLDEILNNGIGDSLEKQLEYFEEVEGFYPLDGTYGIRLLQISSPIFDKENYNIIELK